jgi:K+-transporting ATPase ATPase C chain
MKRNLITSALAVIVFTVLLGLVYPLVITGIAQVAFGKNADGNPDLIAKAWTKPVLDASGQPKKDADGNAVTEPDPRYFQPRPSQTDYNANGTFFSNRGPNQASAR